MFSVVQKAKQIICKCTGAGWVFCAWSKRKFGKKHMCEDVGSVKYELIPYDNFVGSEEFDFDKIIYDLNSQIDLLSSQADNLDYIIAVASGTACALLDILWVGEFDLARGRNKASAKVDSFVKKTAEILQGKKFKDVKSAVKALEERFPIPSDANTPDFGGGLQHHLRDFAHHPTIVGLIFSLLTQFTSKSYGTNAAGTFMVFDVPARAAFLIGKDIPQKILMGTITWFFHLVSDMAGSSATAGITGGTGIPGPILSLAKEMSALPFFSNIKVNDDTSLSLFLSKLFNGTLFMQRDEKGKIIKDSVLKFDLRGELGVALELGRQAIPVIANECIVRSFYFIRRLAMAMKKKHVSSLADMKKINWDDVKPVNNPTIARMLTIATGVFTTLDIGEAIVSQKYWVSVNYVGVGRFALAIGSDISWGLKAHKVKKIRSFYENIKQQTYRKTDNYIKREGTNMAVQLDKLGLSLEQTEILYNIEYYKTLHDVEVTHIPITGESVKALKKEWIEQWKKFISDGFESFTQVSGAQIHWYSREELDQHIAQNNPSEPWYRLVLLEAMLFEPYYPLELEKDNKDNSVPSQKYSFLNNPINGFKNAEGYRFLNGQFTGEYCDQGYVERLRKSYDQVMKELDVDPKKMIVPLAAVALAIGVPVVAGVLAGPIAVALVGAKFVELHGAALVNACLAYLGGGAIAAGGAGMLGGTVSIVGGGAALGIGVGAGVGGAVASAGLTGKKNTIIQSAKLLTSVKEIFLNDEHDIEFADSVYEQYLQNITDIEKGLVELRLKKDVAQGDEKKSLSDAINNAEESVKAMKVVRKVMLKYNSSFAEGLQAQGEETEAKE
ncbi:hypothetical protein [Alloscardovia omnicolens]|uniref:hypothetical protein n=1 Tax=Alloscardovia omnicolens TaxID=419015 RepID=UPI003A734FC7